MGLTNEVMKEVKKSKSELTVLFNKLLSKHGKVALFVCMNSWMNAIKKKDSASKLIKAKEAEIEKLKKELKQ